MQANENETEKEKKVDEILARILKKSQERAVEKFNQLKHNLWKVFLGFFIEFISIAFLIMIAMIAIGLFGKAFSFRTIFDSIIVGIVLGFIITIAKRTHIFDTFKRSQ